MAELLSSLVEIACIIFGGGVLFMFGCLGVFWFGLVWLMLRKDSLGKFLMIRRIYGYLKFIWTSYSIIEFSRVAMPSFCRQRSYGLTHTW